MNKYIFDQEKCNKVLNYIKQNILSDNNIQHLINQCKGLGELILLGGAIKDIAFFNVTPKDYDMVIISDTNKRIELDLDTTIFNVKRNSFGGYKIDYRGITFDIWNYTKMEDIITEGVRFNLDGLYINFYNNEYNAELFNEGIKENVCKAINNKAIHPDINRDFDRGQSLADRFNVRYEYSR